MRSTRSARRSPSRPAETRRVFAGARELGLPVKLHADQLSDLGGAALSAEFGGLSADHIEHTSLEGVRAMAAAGTVAVLLPGAFYALRETQLPPIAALREHGVPMAVATDLNPGTSPLLSLRLAMNMACTLFRLTPEEALRGTTVHAARALGLTDRGTLSRRPARRFRRLGYRGSGRPVLLDRRFAGAPGRRRRRPAGRLRPMLFRRMGGNPPASNRSIGLALQGGGAHGAFTWGVLDRLLEQADIGFERISGTSSGAINALALAQGWMDGGREGARACLDSVWTRIAGHTHAAAWIFGTQSKVGQKTAQSLHRYFTPRQINPLGFNPVRQIAEASFDFERLREQAPFPLHLAATRVRDGALVMFGPEQPEHRCPARIDLPAADVRAGHDRRRGLLGWRLGRQSGARAADL